MLLVLGWYDYRLHRGIERYALNHGWRLYEGLVRESGVPKSWDGDGILAWLGADNDLADFVFQARKPTVDFSFRRPQFKLVRVLEDTVCEAQIVADHFLSRGFRHFAFYSDMENWIYEERGEAFLKSLTAAGRQAFWLKWHAAPCFCNDRNAWRKKQEWLLAELRRLPKPLGVFAATDRLALELVQICEDSRLVVPDEVAVVGAGNSLLAVDTMCTPISSVDPNMDALGYRGAEELDKMMRHKPGPVLPIRVPPARLIVRKSSDLMAVNHPGISRSLRFMREHYHEPIGVADLVRIAAMSRRRFHEVFKNCLGRSPGGELQHIRIERAKDLLMQSAEKIDAVAEKCGYQSGNSFWVAFRQVTGMTPSKFRAQMANALPPSNSLHD
ncbi:MAG TPA: substrate-binding domain-containing protein [Verrucomicrobiae bacterium]